MSGRERASSLSFYSWKQDKWRCSCGGKESGCSVPGCSPGPILPRATWVFCWQCWMSEQALGLPATILLFCGLVAVSVVVVVFLLRYWLLELDDLYQSCFWWWCRILPPHQHLWKRMKVFEVREWKGHGFPKKKNSSYCCRFILWTYFPSLSSPLLCPALVRLWAGYFSCLACYCDSLHLRWSADSDFSAFLPTYTSIRKWSEIFFLNLADFFSFFRKVKLVSTNIIYLLPKPTNHWRKLKAAATWHFEIRVCLVCIGRVKQQLPMTGFVLSYISEDSNWAWHSTIS